MLVGGGGAIVTFFANQGSRNNDIFEQRLNSSACRIASPTQGLTVVKVRAEAKRGSGDIANISKGDKVLFLEEQAPFVKVELGNRSQGWIYNNQISSCNSPSGNNNLSDNPLVSPTSQPDNNNSISTRSYKCYCPVIDGGFYETKTSDISSQACAVGKTWSTESEARQNGSEWTCKLQ